MANFLAKPTLGLYDHNADSDIDEIPQQDSSLAECSIPLEKILSKDSFRTYYLGCFERQHLTSICK